MPYEFTHQYERNVADFYIDPPECSEELFRKIKFDGHIYDPACGNGTIVKSAIKCGYDAVGSDIIDRGYVYHKLVNYLEDQHEYFNIVTNPPYNLVEEFALHSLQFTINKTALLVRLAFLEGQGRFKRLFSKHPPLLILVFSKRPSMPPP